MNELESDNAGGFFSFLGIVCVLVGWGLSGIVETKKLIGPILGAVYAITHHPYFFAGSIFIGVGVSWFIVAVIFFFADREVSGYGVIATFFLGILGAILWLLLSREEYVNIPSARTQSEGEQVQCLSCKKAVSMHPIRYRWCPYCGEKLK